MNWFGWFSVTESWRNQRRRQSPASRGAKNSFKGHMVEPETPKAWSLRRRGSLASRGWGIGRGYPALQPTRGSGGASCTIWSKPLPINLLSYHGLYLIICLITSYSTWSHVYACRPVRLLCSCVSCFFRVFMFCRPTDCALVFYQWHFIVHWSIQLYSWQSL